MTAAQPTDLLQHQPTRPAGVSDVLPLSDVDARHEYLDRPRSAYKYLIPTLGGRSATQKHFAGVSGRSNNETPHVQVPIERQRPGPEGRPSSLSVRGLKPTCSLRRDAAVAKAQHLWMVRCGPPATTSRRAHRSQIPFR